MQVGRNPRAFVKSAEEVKPVQAITFDEVKPVFDALPTEKRVAFLRSKGLVNEANEYEHYLAEQHLRESLGVQVQETMEPEQPDVTDTEGTESVKEDIAVTEDKPLKKTRTRRTRQRK